MSTNLRIVSLARTAAVAMALAIPAVTGFVTSARAEDGGAEFSMPLSSAASARFANPAETPLARATVQARVSSSRVAAASNAPIVGATLDLNGEGGAQDRLAREIYHPGTGSGGN